MIEYLKKIIEEKEGVPSTMRILAIAGFFLLAFISVYSVITGQIEKATTCIVGLAGVIFGTKALQSFAE